MKTIQELEAEIKELEEQAKTLKDQLYDNAIDQKTAYVELWCLTTGLKVGDKVKFKEGAGIKKGELTGFKYEYGKVHPVVTFFKADGSLGLRKRDYWYSSRLELDK